MRKLFFLLLLLFPLFVKAQQPFVRDLWLNESNTSVKVNEMLQDPTGYIWLGTDIGLFRYNGRTFIQISDSIGKPVTALAYGNGNVYVGFSEGTLGYVSQNSIERVVIENERPSTTINSIYTDGSKIMWLCTEEGLFTVVNNIGLLVNNTKGLSDNFVYQIALLPDKRLLAATDIGINEISLKQKKLQINALTDANGLPDNIVRIIKSIPDRPWFWLGMQQKGVAFYCPERKKVWQPEFSEPWTWGQVNDVLPVEKDRAWVCTEEGYLLELTIRDSTHVDVRSIHLKDKKLKKLVRGRSGILWVATNHGISLVSDEYMAYIPMGAPYKLSEIRAMVGDKHNYAWFSEGNRLYRLNLNDKAPQPELVATLPKDITCLYADNEMRVWIGTLGEGLWYRESNGALTHVTEVVGLTQESILDIAGTDDRLWISGLNGVKELSYPSTYTKQIVLLRKHNKDSGIGSDYVYQLFPDRKGRVWMATDGAGIRMYDEGRYKKWDASSGFTSKVIYNITQDGFGNIWAVSLYNGLYRFDGTSWRQISREHGLQDVNISTIAANATGQVIAVHAKGIDAWYPYSYQFRNYNKRQGFNIDSNSAVLKLAAKDTAGNVYIPYEHGWIVFKNVRQQYDIRPIVKLSSVSVYFKQMPEGEKDFDYDQNHISFLFDGVSFANPERLRYRYKLEGYNDSWIQTNDESVTFPQLATGSYKFRVQASLNNTFSRFGEASYSFTVAKPFWARTWFIILVIAALLGTAYMYIMMRERNLRKVSSLQRERMVFEYEHLKSQVNPHFLFNSLNTLANLIDENSNAAIDYTVRLSDLYRNMLSYRDKDLILLTEEWEILENYLYIQKSRFGDALKLEVTMPEGIKHSRKIVPLALQLLVENAIKHNVVSKAKPLTIKIVATDNSITISNPVQPKLSKEKGAGLGLMNIRKRYNLLSKKQIYFGAINNEFVVKLPLI
jgi:ligand-binding sensor domain-containing protein